MALSWNEIKKRALEFSKEYTDATRENAETQSFYNDFFNVFGISRRRIATFEEPVKKLGDKHGRIDLFWKGQLLVEQKSAGRDLAKAKTQALEYFPNLKEGELPKYVLVSDFQNFELYDLDEDTEVKFQLKDLHKHVNHFGFIAGYTKRKFEDQEPVNIKAGELIGDLHDRLVENGYVGHELEQFLIRLLFALFADDTGIFEKDSLKFYIEERTAEDGSDLGSHIERIFQVLNKPKAERQKNIDEELNNFPYINGNLFEGYLPIVQFDSAMRAQLIECCNFDWSQISPAIFGAMFQSATDQQKRRNLGAHYTSEQNIMKIIKPLFLDELYERFNAISQPAKLKELHEYIASLKFLDPACGCGNFLIIAYRELRELELRIILRLIKTEQLELDVSEYVKVNIDQFYGIEIEELPAKIAEVAMWLVDHQMNMKLSEALGLYFARIPLANINNIIHANALRMHWEDLVKPEELSYILGNPPFIGKHNRTSEQTEDMENVFSGVKAAGLLDFVTAWYLKAAKFIQNTQIKVAFVSTNSISQGEQVGVLWNELFNNHGIKIHFAHRTFAWNNEARGNAAVFCVIIGFANHDTDKKFIYEYDTPKSEPQELKVKNINPYLVGAADIVVSSRTKPFSEVPSMIFGSKPVDEGNYFFTNDEKVEFVNKEPASEKFFKKVISAKEFLNNKIRWCLWLKGAKPEDLKKCPAVLQRIENVQKFRLASKKAPTREAASTPTLFAEIRQPETDYLVFPRVSSENRKYIPIGFYSKGYILSDSCIGLPDATLYHFGILTSLMHNDWMRYTAGRLKSDYRYSNKLVYNNFPFPKNPSEKHIKTIEEKAQVVLDAREIYPDSSLADLYNPLTMPSELAKAHKALDKAVDATYSKRTFKDERERIEFLFELYQEYTQPLIGAEKKKKSKK